MDGLTGLLARPDVRFTLTAVGIVALATVSLVLLWEGARNWLRELRTARALRRVHGHGEDDSAAATAKAGHRALLDDEGGWGPEWLEAILLKLPHRQDLQRLLEQAGRRNWSATSVLMVCFGLAASSALVVATFTAGTFPMLLFAAGGAVLPIALLKRMRTKRFAAFEEHFAEAIDLLGRAARAGHSLAAGLNVVADEGEEPVASEFRRVYDEQRFGLPMQDALLGLADRIDLVDVRIFVTAVLIQRESGGNLAENLDGLSQVIRLRFRFRRDVRTKSAHGRMTGTVVAAAPLVAGLGMYTINPTYMSPLLVEPLGRMVLLIGFLMMTTGFVIIRRMVDLEI